MSEFKSIGPLAARAVMEAARRADKEPPRWMSKLAQSVRDYTPGIEVQQEVVEKDARSGRPVPSRQPVAWR